MQSPVDFVVANPDLATQLAALQAGVTQLASMASHYTLGMTTAHGLEIFKSTSVGGKIWAVLTPRWKTASAAILAFFASLGITAVFHVVADPNHPGVYTTSILWTGLYAPSIGQHLWSFIQEWVFQQKHYQQVIQPKQVVGATATQGAPPVVPVAVTEQKP